jgi:8-oxo-dGTP pyrophosphatase MutT (NUDIX family)
LPPRHKSFTLGTRINEAPWAIEQVLYQVGIITFRVENGELEVLLVTSRDTGRWIIPKGNIDAGLTPAKAALREAYEEAGVSGSIVGTVPIGFYTYFKRLKCGTLLDTTVEVFLARAERQHKKWPEKKERSVAWLPVHEAIARIQEPSVMPLLERVEEIAASLIAAEKTRRVETHTNSVSRDGGLGRRGRVLAQDSDQPLVGYALRGGKRR